ncbi:hypothetical protein GGTG_05779 [Gaeumannomyces tritici R3-111a-1]|uniref:Uncharacterized protein n=1 Tax=Gaeumannomyces tritici (strain R3-111a-1) TaxID=644352 RepID=J3NWW8_GAET3|nr:hypothetical protein GGTG_05779 [Gaeumannomyces tritici R3-111a-1]EJT75850.1 hypothetical protein GGTG_05779 [Gaeumannomyces tritici R3-111a-1]
MPSFPELVITLLNARKFKVYVTGPDQGSTRYTKAKEEHCCSWGYNPCEVLISDCTVTVYTNIFFLFSYNLCKHIFTFNIALILILIVF